MRSSRSGSRVLPLTEDGVHAGKPQMAQCRNEFVDTFDFTNNTFVQAMRAFLGYAVASLDHFVAVC